MITTTCIPHPAPTRTVLAFLWNFIRAALVRQQRAQANLFGVLVV
jgi:hypothetical protein